MRLLNQAKSGKAAQDFPFQLQIHNERAEIFIALMEIDSAELALSQPVNWESLDPESYGNLLCKRYYLLSRWAMSQKAYDLSEKYLQKTESLLPEYAPDLYPDLELRRTRMDIGLGKFKQAGERLKVLEENLETFSIRQKADFHLEKGFYNQVFKKFDISLHELKQALSYYEESLSPLDPALGLVHTFLSYTYRGMRRLKESIHHSKKALNIQEQVLGDHHPIMATSYYYYALTLNQLGDYGRAVKYLEQAIRVYKNALGDTGNSLGNYYASLGFAKKGIKQFKEAGQAYKKALTYYNSPPVFTQIDKPYYNYSLSLITQKNYPEALTYLGKAFEVRKERVGKNSPFMLNIYRAFGECYLEMEAYTKARSYFEKCIDIESENPKKVANRISEYVFKMGKLERREGNPESAFTLYLEALSYFNIDLSSEKLDNLDIVATGSPNMVKNIFFEIGQALTEIAHESENPIERLDQALQVYLQCDHFIDELRLSFLSEETKLNLAGKSRKIFEKGIKLAFELYEKTRKSEYLETAFYLSGKNKSLLLLLGLKESFALRSSGIPEDLINLESDLEQKIGTKKSEQFQQRLQFDSDREKSLAAIGQELFRLNKSKDSLVNILERDYPDYYQLKYDLTLPSVADVQTALPPNMGLIDYFWGEENLYIFFLNKDKIEGYKSEGTDSLKKQLEAFQDLIVSPVLSGSDEDFSLGKKKFVDASRILYEKLLAPLNLESISGIHRLKIIPDGTLGFLKFGLLIADAPDGQVSYRDLPYLIKDYEISNAYSVGQWWYVLQKGPVELKGKDDLLAFRPVYPEIEGLASLDQVSRRGFGPLYFSSIEIENITQYFDSQVFEGDEATEKSFYHLAPEFPLIQISGHAMIPDSAPNAAFIAFTNVNASQYDDSLLLEELYALRLNAEMVVLSACETGVGELLTGEGIMSLGRGFTYAGARSLVMSLWEVNDASTSQIMSDFYEQLSLGSHKDAALRQAMLSYLKGSDQLRAHPYYWAAFVANGDMRALEIKRNPLNFIYLFGLFALISGLLIFFYRKSKN